MSSIHFRSLSLALVFAAACGGGDNTTSDGGNDATAGDSGNGGDSSNNNDSGSDSGPKPSKPYAGSVSLSESKTGNTTSYTASALFYATGDAGTSSGGCSGTMNGSCCFVPPSQADGGTGPTPQAASAGGITLKDGATTIATMTPTGTTYTTVTNPPTTALTWNAGESISVSAAGDTVHVFSGMVAAAALFTNVSPALSIITPASITRSSDFTITWTAATGSILLVLSGSKIATSEGVITCSASSDSGTITVPSALLMNFSANDTGFVSVSRTSSADVSPDNASVSLSSSTSESGTVTFK